MPKDTANEWEQAWNNRQRGLEAVLGEVDDTLFHAPVPLSLGGNADVLRFSHFLPGDTYVTAELTGTETEQLPSSIGNYELNVVRARRTHARGQFNLAIGRLHL
jgi:hypothetical protein